MSVLEIKNLCKSFNGKKIIDDVSFTIEAGKIVGLLGKNGSGKTTIIKLINDLLTIDSGEILVGGHKIGIESKSIISYLPERSYLENSQTVADAIKFFQDFYSDFSREKALKLLKTLNLDENTKLSKMSKGMKEKVQIVLVMSRNATLYILDEPLGGIDPVTRDYIMQAILSNLNENAAMLITTHLIADVEKILDDVIFIDNGKIVLNDSADKLRELERESINDIFRRTIR